MANVGFIGVGNMGNPMAYNVLKASNPMIVFDMNPKAMENLIQAGAKRAGSPREVVENSEIVFTSLPASPDVEAGYLQPGVPVDAGGEPTPTAPGGVRPPPARRTGPRPRSGGVSFGGGRGGGGAGGARGGRRAIGGGGAAEPLQRATPVLRAIGPNIFHVGP